MLSHKILETFNLFNGTLTVKDAEKYNIDRETLRKAFLRGDLERPYRGVYQLPESVPDEMLALQYNYSKGIYSHETALNLHEYGTFSPHKYYMTFPENYNTTNIRKNQIISTQNVKNKFYPLGITQTKTIFGNDILVYDKERTLLDMLSSKTSHDFTLNEMLEDYLFDPDKNIENLKKYAKLMNVEHLLKRVDVFV